MVKPHNHKEDPRFDHLIQQLLMTHEGIFIGEEHQYPAVFQSLGKLMPLLKANGVMTLFIEWPDQMADELLHIESLDNLKDYAQLKDIHIDRLLTAWEVVHSAHNMGVAIRGYEMPDLDVDKHIEQYKTILNDRSLNGRERKEKVEAIIKSLTSVELTERRDDYAARLIKEEAKGKYLVVGGMLHSGNYEVGDSPTVHQIAGSSEAGKALITSYTMKGYKGLSSKLGIPSIDFKLTTEQMEVGSTMKGDNKSANFHAKLPADIYQDPNFPWMPQTVRHSSPDENIQHAMPYRQAPPKSPGKGQ